IDHLSLPLYQSCLTKKMQVYMIQHHTINLLPGKEKPVIHGHPWIFSGAIKSDAKNGEPGDLVDVLDHKNQFLARGFYNPKSQIRVRVLTRNPAEMITKDFMAARIHCSISRRAHLLSSGKTTGVRLVAHESDQLPGLIVDQFGGWLSFQILTAGMERWRTEVIEILTNQKLINHCKPLGIIERSDEAIREKEGLNQRKDIVFGPPLSGPVEFKENGLLLSADLENGHKTGFYLDQRDNRAIIESYARGTQVLNCFSYTGGFTVAAFRGGAASVINVDESQPALDLAKNHLSMNSFTIDSTSFVKADVFKYLREQRSLGNSFDLIILDPPKFVSSAPQIDKACRGYKDLNLLAMQLLRPNGLLATFSCSGLISRDLFQKVVFGASVDAQVEMQVIKHLSQSEDHPTLLSFPESLYLKGLLLRKI
ncbi:MAG: class I SAM-dependent rRNA methyltransferase, partial [Proteobacteria bacterium]|nr:class I SAM-dependent rRNA methyltransferase [Pseudomonadota bacterium]